MPLPRSEGTESGGTPSGMVGHSGRTPEEMHLLTPREMANEFAFLVLVTGRRVGSFFKLDGPRSLIGRSRMVQVFVDDPAAAGEHASIRCERPGRGERGEFILRDLDSENGTYVNGQRIQAMVALADGDVIRIGETEMVFKRV